jgi:hypothetical protein
VIPNLSEKKSSLSSVPVLLGAEFEGQGTLIFPPLSLALARAAVAIGDISLTAFPVIILTVLDMSLVVLSVDFVPGNTEVPSECAVKLVVVGRRKRHLIKLAAVKGFVVTLAILALVF